MKYINTILENFLRNFILFSPSPVPKYNIWENSGKFLGPFNHSFFKVWKLTFLNSKFKIFKMTLWSSIDHCPDIKLNWFVMG